MFFGCPLSILFRRLLFRSPLPGLPVLPLALRDKGSYGITDFLYFVRKNSYIFFRNLILPHSSPLIIEASNCLSANIFRFVAAL